MRHLAGQDLTLTTAERDALRQAVSSSSSVQTAAWLGVARGTLERAVGGLPLRRGSVLLLRAAIANKPEGEAP